MYEKNDERLAHTMTIAHRQLAAWSSPRDFKATMPDVLSHSRTVSSNWHSFIRLAHSCITLDRLIIPAGISHHEGDGMNECDIYLNRISQHLLFKFSDDLNT